MRKCKECGYKIKFKENLKSSFNKHGKVICSNCNSVFVLKKGIFRYIYELIGAFIGAHIAISIGGYKGVLIGTLVMILLIIIRMNLDKQYVLIKK